MLSLGSIIEIVTGKNCQQLENSHNFEATKLRRAFCISLPYVFPYVLPYVFHFPYEDLALT